MNVIMFEIFDKSGNSIAQIHSEKDLTEEQMTKLMKVWDNAAENSENWFKLKPLNL